MNSTCLLNYTESGKGLPVVFIHGFCENKSIWKDFQNHLSAKFRVITPDLPGFGASVLKRKEISIEFMADKVKDLLDNLQIEHCAMIGHSLGGYVALAFAEKYEPRLNSLGLFHSTAFPDSPEKRKSRVKTVEFIEKHGSSVFADSFVSPLFYEENRERLTETILWLKTIAASSTEAGMIAATLAMKDRKNRVEVLQNIKVPVLFIIGENDPAVPLDASLEQAAMPSKAVKHILAKTGHMGMFERTEDTLKIVEDFLMLL